MSQNIFKNPFVSSPPTLTGASVGNGTLTIDRLTHFTINQDYTAVCTAITPFTVFKIIGSLDGSVGVAVVGTQFYDQDLKVFLTINQGPTTFQIGDTFEFTLDQGTDLNRENIDLYDELPQKNFGVGVPGSISGDYNIRLNTTGIDAFRIIQDLKFTSKISGAEGNEISIEYLAGSVLSPASLIIQDLTYTASPGEAGNGISILYTQFTPGVAATRDVQDINWTADNIGVNGNYISMVYIGGGTAGSEIVNVTGTGTGGDPYIITVTIEDGVSSADQIRLAVGLHGVAGPLVDGIALGTGLEPQSIQAQIFLLGGLDPIGDAGNEVVNVVALQIEVILESGVSTAQNVYDAVFASPAALALVTPTISGTPATTQTAPVAEANLTGGADDVGLPGSEVVNVSDKAIEVTFNDGLSTADQIKTAIEGDIDANALVTVTIEGVGANFQDSPVVRTFLRSGQLAGTFAFNSEELTVPGSFFEGNANILANNLNLQNELNVEGESEFRGKVKFDDAIPANNSGPLIENNQKTINNLIQNGKVFLHTVNDEKMEWSDPAGTLTLLDDINIVFCETNIVNTILATDGPFVIADGEHLYVTVDRENNVNLTTTIASTVPNSPNGENIFRLVSRVGDSLVWFDNTLQTEGKNIRIGEGGAGGVGYQEKLGNGDGAVTAFGPLTFIPSSEKSILVFSNVINFVTTDWTYNVVQNQIDFITPPPLGAEIYVFYLTEGETLSVPTPSGVERVEYRDITLAEETAKQLTLANLPAEPTKVKLDIIGGSAQRYTVDFIVTGSILSWSGLRLDGVLVENSEVRINYYS